MHSLGSRGVILGDWEASQAPFWVLWESLGYLFGCFGGRVGSILGALGTLGLHFGGFGGPVAAFGGLWGRPWPPKGPKVKFSHFFPSHLGVILASCWS